MNPSPQLPYGPTLRNFSIFFCENQHMKNPTSNFFGDDHRQITMKVALPLD